MVEKICWMVLEGLLQISMSDKICKKCGHLCHCMEADHTGCKCAKCACNTSTIGGVVVDDTNECETCQ